MYFWQPAKVMSNYQILAPLNIRALHNKGTQGRFYCVYGWINSLILRILPWRLIKYSKGCLQMQSNATVSMFPHLIWMAMAGVLCILCPAVNIWLTLIRKWPHAPGHLYSYPKYFSSLRDLYIRPFSTSLHTTTLITKRCLQNSHFCDI